MHFYLTTAKATVSADALLLNDGKTLSSSTLQFHFQESLVQFIQLMYFLSSKMRNFSAAKKDYWYSMQYLSLFTCLLFSVTYRNLLTHITFFLKTKKTKTKFLSTLLTGGFFVTQRIRKCSPYFGKIYLCNIQKNCVHKLTA